LLVAGLGRESSRWLPGTLFHPAVAEPPAVGRPEVDLTVFLGYRIQKFFFGTVLIIALCGATSCHSHAYRNSPQQIQDSLQLELGDRQLKVEVVQNGETVLIAMSGREGMITLVHLGLNRPSV
jgi:hypothetical protein